jgi:mRNA interferase RelE/StbE
MAWYRLAFRPAVMKDLSQAGQPMAQRLFDKTKWIASNVDNLRHQTVAQNLPNLCKYAVGDWRIFYSIDRTEQIVDIHHIVHRTAL